ncbi:putative amidoligase enzyme-domain-containing protein [Chaetomium fimeti]|uniref:Amidoligase enzyme-domain-containing protein n=1 Tax=Chaetomium fimeti TaxID=1854472 RepID=A0AAE0HAK7_9PEZI|nr:putative amidoligase enzyme-domain-containing protein [Chaetomium fimeti]
MSASTARPAPAQRLPLFGVEIEMFIKVKPSIEALTREKQRTNPTSLPEWWRKWDFDLKNDPPDRAGEIGAVFHRIDVVNSVVQVEIDTILGPNNGWRCTYDPSLSERKLALPPDARKWWAVEIVSPPMSVSKQWQQEIDMVYMAVSRAFDIYTTDFCGCHVHISPGPVISRENRYKTAELVRMAKASFFWEAALYEYLPQDRRNTPYAVANHKVCTTKEYEAVPQKGWGPVFDKLDSLAAGDRGETRFLEEIQGGDINGDRYTSFNFSAFTKIGTVEFRRQAGALSPITTGHRILLAVGLHLSAMRYDFDGAKTRKTYPSAEELRKELAGCIKKLPGTCHGSRFLNYLTWCHESYQGGKTFTEAQINVREQALRNGVAPPAQQSAIQPARPAFVPGEGRVLQHDTPSPTAGTTPRPTTTTGTARGGNAASQGTGSRAPAAETTPRASAGAGTGRGGAPQSTGRGGATQGAGRGAPSNSQGGGGAGGAGRAPAARTGTTRLPERPAPSGSTPTSRPAASGNPAAPSSSSRTGTTGNNTRGTAAGGTRPARRRREGENA